MTDLAGGIDAVRFLARAPAVAEVGAMPSPLLSAMADGGLSFDGVAASMTSARPPAVSKPGSKVENAHREFEAFVLQNFIEAMLPDGADNVFGKGIAGETWKSMLAEKLATEVSRSGHIGIAERIAGADQTHTSGEVSFTGHFSQSSRAVAGRGRS